MGRVFLTQWVALGLKLQYGKALSLNFFFNDVQQVKIHLEQKHVDKPNWLYNFFSIDKLERLRIDTKKAFEIRR